MKDKLQSAIGNICNDTFKQQVAVELSRTDPRHGDFSTNVAMQLAKPLAKSPLEIAGELIVELQQIEAVETAAIAGPGFINIRVNQALLLDELGSAIEKADRYGENKIYDGQSIVIETNNPNPFKDLHIGHAYNSVVADTIANLLEKSGANLHRVSYHGDVGLHVGKSMWAILKYTGKDTQLLHNIQESERPAFMSKMYSEGSKAYDNDEIAKNEIIELAQESFSLKDPLYRDIYQICKKWSFDYIDRTIERLGSRKVEKRYLESEADTVGVKTVKQHIGEVFENSQGAVIFPEEKSNLHTEVFISGEGRGLYAARDMGLMQLKNRDFQPEKSIIVTGSEQRNYFKVVIRAAEMAMPELSGITMNISTGLVKLSTGKMSSRTGDVLNIEWLFRQLDEAVVKRGNSQNDDVTIGALRYTLLKPRIGSDVVFDIKEAVSVEGNSGPYLQYSHSRAKSIISKSDKQIDVSNLQASVLVPEERGLAVKITEYPEVVQRAAADMMPHYVCTYLYELAQSFNSFYEKNRVIGDERESIRLAMVAAYANTLESGLGALGIPAPERI